MVEKRSSVGKVNFASLRKLYGALAEGNSITTYNYTYRIDSKKISTDVRFIQDSLCVNPGVMRDVTISGHLFESMPVFESGGKSIASLTDA